MNDRWLLGFNRGLLWRTISDPFNFLQYSQLACLAAAYAVMGINYFFNSLSNEGVDSMSDVIPGDVILGLFFAYLVLSVILMVVLIIMGVQEFKEGFADRAHQRDMKLLERQIEVEMLLRNSFGDENAPTMEPATAEPSSKEQS